MLPSSVHARITLLPRRVKLDERRARLDGGLEVVLGESDHLGRGVVFGAYGGEQRHGSDSKAHHDDVVRRLFGYNGK